MECGTPPVRRQLPCCRCRATTMQRVIEGATTMQRVIEGATTMRRVIEEAISYFVVE